MIKKITTNEISIDEWKQKLATDDDDWLLRQYHGLNFLVKSMDITIDNIYHKLKSGKDDISGDDYRENIYPLEDEMMNVDNQLADVETEMEFRGLDLLIEE